MVLLSLGTLGAFSRQFGCSISQRTRLERALSDFIADAVARKLEVVDGLYREAQFSCGVVGAHCRGRTSHLLVNLYGRGC
jgi:hypothetical protein